MLMDGLKFDMRVYVLISSCNPLKIYVYNDGLIRQVNNIVITNKS